VSAILEFFLELFGEIALHCGYWRFFLCLMGGLAIAGVMWWKMAESAATNAMAVGTILTMSFIGVCWECRS
jgi:hypothetical protein